MVLELTLTALALVTVYVAATAWAILKHAVKAVILGSQHHSENRQD